MTSPQRAQKALLQQRLPLYTDSIDTVGCFHGGERELIVISATVSDREFARLEIGFLTEPRRFTVGVFRPTRKLVIISSRAIFDLIPGDLDEYERGALWKHCGTSVRGPAPGRRRTRARAKSTRALSCEKF